MAKQTDLSLRSKTFYQVFPRQYSDEHNFKAVTNDLERIKDMGVDILYLLPIHPIGKKARKGAVGSPYSIVDYYQIHEDLGTLDDFIELIDKAHALGMKVMIDIVFNHTSRDSVLVEKHPEWFYKNEKGEFANRVGDWSDITDLDFNQKDVWQYLIDVLRYWSTYVDGFRCDVAPLLPLDFWLEARKQVSIKRPDLIWLTESVHLSFIKYIRDLGYDAHSDSEMYQAFDICYDYDIHDDMYHYLEHKNHLPIWLNKVYQQEMIYPKNYVKLRSFENHDQRRLRSKTRDEKHFIQMVAMEFFIKGAAFIYNGMEYQDQKAPSLFEYDVIQKDQSLSIEHLIKRFAEIKKDPIFIHGNFNLHHTEDVAIFSYTDETSCVVGIFNLENCDEIEVPLKDGNYQNHYNQQKVHVKHGKMKLTDEPIMVWAKREDKK